MYTELDKLDESMRELIVDAGNLLNDAVVHGVVINSEAIEPAKVNALLAIALGLRGLWSDVNSDSNYYFDHKEE